MVARKIIHKDTMQPTTTEWRQAMTEWEGLRRTVGRINSDFSNLTKKQLGLWFQAEKDMKSLKGEAVMLIASPDGRIYSDYPYPATIVNVTKSGSEYRFQLLMHETDYTSWGGEEHFERCALHRIIQVRNVYLPTIAQEKEKNFNLLIAKINTSKRAQLTQLESNKRSYEMNVKQLERDLTRYQQLTADMELKIKAAQVETLDKKAVLSLFGQLKKNKQIADAYMTAEGSMIVETKMLYATTPVKHLVNKKKPIGRMAFELNMQGLDYCNFTNLDYCFHYRVSTSHYPHPNISGSKICAGDNGPDLNNMIKAGDFYEMIDFLIMFFSLFPQDGGSPHITHETWMAARRPEKKTNPFFKRERYWELHPRKAANTRGRRGGTKTTPVDYDGLEMFVSDPRHKLRPPTQAISSLEALRAQRMGTPEATQTAPPDYIQKFINQTVGEIRWNEVAGDNPSLRSISSSDDTLGNPGNIQVSETLTVPAPTVEEMKVILNEQNAKDDDDLDLAYAKATDLGGEEDE